MGAWGAGSFENDVALDWVDGLNYGYEASSLNDDLHGHRWPEEDDACCVALAVAEVIAAARGYPHPELPDAISNWLAENASHVSVELLPRAIGRVTQIGENSGLREMWVEGDGLLDWLPEIDNLRTRLEATMPQRE